MNCLFCQTQLEHYGSPLNGVYQCDNHLQIQVSFFTTNQNTELAETCLSCIGAFIMLRYRYNQTIYQQKSAETYLYKTIATLNYVADINPDNFSEWLKRFHNLAVFS